LPRPKRFRVLTSQPAHTEAAVSEWGAGIEQFIDWANRARKGETSKPEAQQLDVALTAFSQGSFHVPFNGLALWAVAAGRNILTSVRDGHWHLARCHWCDQWFLAKDHRRVASPSCRREPCVRAKEKEKKAAARRARRELDHGLVRRARSTF
jgi:hypothetical protein